MQNKVQIILEADYEINNSGGVREPPRLRKKKASPVPVHVMKIFKSLCSPGFTMRYDRKENLFQISNLNSSSWVTSSDLTKL